MAGRHSKRQGAQISVPVQHRPRPLMITDGGTGTEHVMDEGASRRHLGRYMAACGVPVQAASLSVPARGRCPRCVSGGAR